MRVSTADIKKRKKHSDNKQYGIQNYDTDNAYPQNVIDIINNSGIAKSCVSLYGNYLFGRGFDKDMIVNRQGRTLNDLFNESAVDFAKFYGFALHLNYNLNLQISEINFVPFEYCRLGIADDREYYGKVAIYNDWQRVKNKSISKKSIDYVDVYNPIPEVVAAQIEKAGGIDKYKGQIAYISNNNNQYPLAPIDPVLEDAETVGEIKVFKYKNVTSGFMANTMFIHKGKIEDAAEKRDFDANMKRFQGADGSKIMVVEVTDPEQKPEVVTFETPNNDKIFELTEKTVKENIIQAFKQPPILLGIYTPGTLGATKELPEAQEYYNYMTEKDRNFMQRAWNKLLANFIQPIEVEINKVKPYESELNGKPDTI
jgi:hypothetical protein